MKMYAYFLSVLFSLTFLTPSLLHAQVTADFQADKVSGCRPLVVSFEDLSINAASWKWDYEVGTSTIQNPSAFFSLPGTYDVRLIVTDEDGNSDTLHLEDYISVYEFPSADFTLNQSDICINNPVQFTDNSIPNSGQLVSWLWDFGNGKTSTDQHPNVSYTEAGNFPVSLSVSNSHGCSDNVVRANLITVSAPNVAFSGDEFLACGAPHTVNFTSFDSLAGDHLWLFGDGTSSTDPNPSHRYNLDGSYSVSHIVVDSEGCTDTLRKDNLVGIGVNTLTASVLDSSICVNDTAFFTSNAPSNSQILWDFGNGQTDSVANPFVIYTSPGQYLVTAEVSDASGCNYNFEVRVEVSTYPNVSFTVADTTLGCSVPFPVDFINTTVGASSYFWTLGDGTISTLKDPSHIYTSPDSFTVVLIATGPTGCKAQIHPKDYIKIQRVETGFFAEPRLGCAPLQVNFQDTTQSPYPIIDWQWNFGNGNTGTGFSPSMNYTNQGEFDISLITTNSKGCKDTLIMDDYIKAGSFPSMDFDVAEDSTCALTKIQFNNLTTNAQDYLWFFGDGDTAMSENPTHGFLALGDMDVTLVASDRGCTDTLTKTAFVHVKAPLPVIGKNAARLCFLPDSVTLYNLSEQADYSYWTFPDSSTSTDLITNYTLYVDGKQSFRLTAGNDSTGCEVTARDSVIANNIKSRFIPDQPSGCVPLTVTFSDSSINAVEWKWYFGNGDSSSLQNPSYTYTIPGSYEVTLVARNSFYCRDTLIYTHIQARGPKADFRIIGNSDGCVPFDLQLEDISTSTSSISNWEWDFGDGVISTDQNPTHTYVSPDLFNISLSITDNYGCSDTLVKEEIAFITQPIPNFGVNPPVNCLDENSTFISQSSGSGLFYTWDFGDGEISHLANTFHSYADTGYYSISLHVTDVNGCDSSITKPNFVEIRDLEANFWADTLEAPCPPLTVHFRADNSFPHIGVNWKWDFGDGASSTEVFPTHIYNSPGAFTVSLILESPQGCADTMIVEDMIKLDGPVSSFSYTPLGGCQGTEIFFTVDTVKSGISYDWIFGDGNRSSLDSVLYTYADHGLFFPILVAKDSLGCEVFSANDDPIEINGSPRVSFDSDQQLFCNQATVNFQDLSSVPGSGIRSWKWYFGDGDSSSLQHPVHSYPSLGAYEVKLIIESFDGCVDSLIRPNFITVVASPVPSITLDKSEACGSLDIAYEGSFKPYPALVPYWSWNFGDGTQALGKSGTHTYTDTGTFIINLEVLDSYGCVGKVLDTVTVHSFPTFDFSASGEEGCAPIEVSFAANSTESQLSWQWNFGDGQQDSIQNPLHSYMQNGVFNVSLFATNSHGCTSYLEKENLIILSEPIADFELSENVICSGSSIALDDKSFGNSPITEWIWDFGDGSSSTQSAPVHAYPQGGVYDISLIVKDDLGCADTLVQSNALTVITDSLPDPTQLTRLSTLSDTEIEVSYERYPNPKHDFQSYLVYRQDLSGTYSLIDSIQDITQLSYRDKNLNTRDQVYCYKVLIRNHCGQISNLGKALPHCSIELQSQGGVEQISISWNKYKGWTMLDAYNIYRVSGYLMTDSEFIASVSSSDSVYVDDNILCTGTYAYRIEAIGPGGLISYSDTSVAVTSSQALTEVSNVVNATVENDEFIKVEFQVAAIKNASSLIIERDAGNGFQELSRLSVTGASGKYQDQNADVHDKSYTYRAFTADTCGKKTPIGQTAKSIYAKARQKGNQISLSWNAYEGWENGVEAYKVERFDEASNAYVEIALLGGSLTEFEDISPLKGNSLNCYRIQALEQGGNGMLSVSNSNCIGLDPVMFTATGFTPNGDGINDEFKVSLSFVDAFELTIYNRWGKVVFRTNNPEDAWKGTTQNGKPAPEGVYLYSVTGKGRLGQFVKNSGSLSLIR